MGGGGGGQYAAKTPANNSYEYRTKGGDPCRYQAKLALMTRYHSVATMGQIIFIFTVLGPSLNVPI